MMPPDAFTITVLSAVGGTGVSVGAGLWIYMKSLHSLTVKEWRTQNSKLEKRAADCESDRDDLHERINLQSERITDISKQLGRLEGLTEQMVRHVAIDNTQNTH